MNGPDGKPPFFLFDAHCHLQDERFEGHVMAVVSRARQVGVFGMMCCATRESDWESVCRLAHSPGIYASFGIHPWFAATATNAWLSNLEHLLRANPLAAVGEIGLDFAVKSPSRELQEEVFAMQVRLARDLQRPVSIHYRKAFGRLAEIVERESGIPYGGLIHSYSGSKDFALVLERLGFYLSFSGSITHAGNKHGREALSAVSLPRLLIETDSPDLPPEGLPRNGVNEPANLSVVLSAVADLLGRPKEEIAKLTKENSERLFGANTSSKYGGCGVL